MRLALLLQWKVMLIIKETKLVNCSKFKSIDSDSRKKLNHFYELNEA